MRPIYRVEFVVDKPLGWTNDDAMADVVSNLDDVQTHRSSAHEISPQYVSVVVTLSAADDGTVWRAVRKARNALSAPADVRVNRRTALGLQRVEETT